MLTVTIAPGQKKAHVELDADKFERLAAALGLFNADFLRSVEQAEREIAVRKTKTLKSLRDLRRS